MRTDHAIMTKNMASTVHKVEMKLLFIPIFFILLRVWSLVLTVIEIEAGKSLSCPVVWFFIHIGVSFQSFYWWSMNDTVLVISTLDSKFK